MRRYNAVSRHGDRVGQGAANQYRWYWLVRGFLLIVAALIVAWWRSSGLDEDPAVSGSRAEVRARPPGDSVPLAVPTGQTFGMSPSPFAACASPEQCAGKPDNEPSEHSLPVRVSIDKHLKAIDQGNLFAAVEAANDLVNCVQEYKNLRMLADAAGFKAVGGLRECSAAEAADLSQELDRAFTRRVATNPNAPEALLAQVAWLVGKAVVDDTIISQSVGEITRTEEEIEVRNKDVAKVSVFWKQAWALAHANHSVSQQLANMANELAFIVKQKDGGGS